MDTDKILMNDVDRCIYEYREALGSLKHIRYNDTYYAHYFLSKRTLMLERRKKGLEWKIVFECIFLRIVVNVATLFATKFANVNKQLSKHDRYHS